jgi:hypothetical protein
VRLAIFLINFIAKSKILRTKPFKPPPGGHRGAKFVFDFGLTTPFGIPGMGLERERNISAVRDPHLRVCRVPVFLFCFMLESLHFCELGAHAQFYSPTTGFFKAEKFPLTSTGG